MSILTHQDTELTYLLKHYKDKITAFIMKFIARIAFNKMRLLNQLYSQVCK